MTIRTISPILLTGLVAWNAHAASSVGTLEETKSSLEGQANTKIKPGPNSPAHAKARSLSRIRAGRHPELRKPTPWVERAGKSALKVAKRNARPIAVAMAAWYFWKWYDQKTREHDAELGRRPHVALSPEMLESLQRLQEMRVGYAKPAGEEMNLGDLIQLNPGLHYYLRAPRVSRVSSLDKDPTAQTSRERLEIRVNDIMRSRFLFGDASMTEEERDRGFSRQLPSGKVDALNRLVEMIAEGDPVDWKLAHDGIVLFHQLIQDGRTEADRSNIAQAFNELLAHAQTGLEDGKLFVHLLYAMQGLFDGAISVAVRSGDLSQIEQIQAYLLEARTQKRAQAIMNFFRARYLAMEGKAAFEKFKADLLGLLRLTNEKSASVSQLIEIMFLGFEWTQLEVVKDARTEPIHPELFGQQLYLTDEAAKLFHNVASELPRSEITQGMNLIGLHGLIREYNKEVRDQRSTTVTDIYWDEGEEPLFENGIPKDLRWRTFPLFREALPQVVR